MLGTFQISQIKLLHLRSGPRRSAQEVQARFDTWVVRKAADADVLPQRLPAIVIDELGENSFQCLPLERTFWFCRFHGSTLSIRSASSASALCPTTRAVSASRALAGSVVKTSPSATRCPPPVPPRRGGWRSWRIGRLLGGGGQAARDKFTNRNKGPCRRYSRV